MYTVIKIKKKYSSNIECVTKYYGILNILNSLGLCENEIIILSYIQVGGKGVYGMPESTFYKHKKLLKDRGLIIGDKVHPQLHIEFEKLVLNIQIEEA